MKTHELKCWQRYFEPLIEGKKTFEFRYDDRGYKVGDQLYLREWDHVAEKYTGRAAFAEITYILDDSALAQLPGKTFEALATNWVVLALKLDMVGYGGLSAKELAK